MSSSTLSALPSSDDGIQLPLPRKTYGRRRPPSPAEEDDRPSLFFPSSTPLAALAPGHSPAKGLLNRWSHASTSWRDSLDFDNDGAEHRPTKPSDLGLTTARPSLTNYSFSQESGKDEDDDEDAIRKAMERMRREARGEVVDQPLPQRELPQSRLGVPFASTSSHSLDGPGRKLAAFSSSTLTALSSSQPASSPPRAPRRSPSPLKSAAAQRGGSINEIETIPVRKSGFAKASGKVKRIVTSSDEEEDIPNHKSSPPRLSRRGATASTSSGPSLTIEVEANPLRPQGRQSTPDSEAEDDDPGDVLNRFLATMADEDNGSEEKENDGEEGVRSRSNSEDVGLFDDEDMGDKRKQKGKKLKGLNKKEREEMQKDIWRAAQTKSVHLSKPVANHLPFSHWLKDAAQVVEADFTKSEIPALTHGGRSPRTSPMHRTPVDDIAAFTPSSADHRKLNPLAGLSKISIEPTSSSPTRQPQRSVRQREIPPALPAISNSDDDEELPDLLTVLKEAEAQQKKDDERKERQRHLAAIKARFAGATANKKTMMTPAPDADDDFEIYQDVTPRQAAQPVRVLPILQKDRRMPDAKAVLNLSKSAASPAITRQRQQVLKFSGKNARSRDQATETLLDFAGKTFNHADLRRANAGSKPAGQKNGRQAIVSQAQVDEVMRQKHQEQVAKLQKKREEEWGRTRKLPDREQQDLAAMVEMSAKASTIERPDSDDEGEDEDYDPSGEDEDDVIVEDELEVFSGEESEAEEGPEEGSEEEEALVRGTDTESVFAITSGEADKENRRDPPMAQDEEEEESILKRPSRPRPSTRAIVDSDDEERTPKAISRAPLADMPHPHAADKTPEPMEIDLAGFASGGSPGFSQLFEATQLATADDGFTAMRDAPQALLPVHMLLPGVDISLTQAARDNQLIAAEVDAAMDEQLHEEEQPKKQYLNEKGFFTQTRPVVPKFPSTMMASGDGSPMGFRRSTLAGASTTSLGDRGDFESMSILRNPSENPMTTSPTQDGGQRLTRLKRRTSDHEILGDLPGSPAVDLEEPLPDAPRRSAFDRMMEAAANPTVNKVNRPAFKTNMIEEQAEESDEDNGWAPINAGDEDEDADGDEDEGYVPDLVDDDKVDEDEKRRQDDLAAEKAREIEQADDARREAQAKKITEGEMRTRRKGMDFDFSDDEDEAGNKRRRWSKKERRKRRLDREDGLDKLDGEMNVFRSVYDETIESDHESVEEAPSPKRQRTASPEQEERRHSGRSAWTALRERARANRGKNLELESIELDREIGFDGAGFGSHTSIHLSDELQVDVEEESQFSISRLGRNNSLVFDETVTRTTTTLRTTESFATYLQEEASLTRRNAGGPAGVSVVGHASTKGLNGGMNARSGMGKPRPPVKQHSTNSSSSSGSILMSKGSRFG